MKHKPDNFCGSVLKIEMKGVGSSQEPPVTSLFDDGEGWQERHRSF